MKKLFFAFICLFMITGASAQRAGFGIKGGMTISAADGSLDGLGWTAGAFLECKGESRFSFAMEALYTQTSYSFGSPGANFPGSEWTMSSLNVPILLGIYPAKVFAFKIGVQPSVLLRIKDKNYGEINNQTDFQFYIPLGIAFEPRNGIRADLRWNFGIDRVDYLSLTLGYRFQKRK